MFPSLSTVCAFHIVQLMRTANHHSNYDRVGHSVHENAPMILYGFFDRTCVNFYSY